MSFRDYDVENESGSLNRPVTGTNYYVWYPGLTMCINLSKLNAIFLKQCTQDQLASDEAT